jgi:transcriptional regulator with XRE-family HTH domain
MPLLRELATAVRQRRQEIGLSQQELAALVDLSRATINELERGKLKDLSSNRIERLANELGFAVGVVGTRRPKEKGAIEAAARVASVPYSTEIPAAALLETLKHGTVPPTYIAQLRTLLQEAPVAILASLADELQEVHLIPRKQTWDRMRMLSRVLNIDRPLWQAPQT